MRVENKLSYKFLEILTKGPILKIIWITKLPHVTGSQSSRFCLDSRLLQDIEGTSRPNSYAIHHRKEE